MGQALPSLEAAMQALSQAQFDKVLSEMDVAMDQLQKMEQLAEALQKMENKLQEMGKTLSEQLNRGQVQAAQKTLEEMSKALNQGGASKQQLKEMMQELQEAEGPAGYYGKVPEHLSEAMKQMQSGNQAQASQALKRAAEELQKMGQQMGDMASLAKALQGLKRSQLAIGNCKGWGQCNSPGFNPFGNKPGSGVGTWAGETPWVDNMPMTGNWDNSNVNRPDMEARGITDRGPGEAPEGMTPSRVKGDFSPGGSMPSIKLEGLSIKGESTASYKQVLKAAQQDAESALSQQKVPRAHQEKVRKYFDELDQP